METLLGQYYGMDWIATISTLIFIYLMGEHKKVGFVFGIIASIAWVGTNYLAQIWPGLLLNGVIIVMHVRAYVKWGKSNQKT